MANKFAYNRSYYEGRYSSSVEGNAARQLEEEYEEVYYSDEELYDENYETADFVEADPDYYRGYEEETEAEENVRIKKKYNFNFLTTALMIVSIIGLLCSAFGYLETMSEISQAKIKLESAKTELADAKSINASLKNRLDVNVDRNYIYTVAVEKLKMTYPADGQTVYYERPDEGYVRQYQSIPTAGK